MAKKSKAITARELLTQLDGDFGYQAMRAAKDEELADIAAKRRDEQKALLDELATNGVAVGWVGELLSLESLDESTYHILLDHLRVEYSPWLLEWIGRSFGRKSARPIVWEALVSLLQTRALEAAAADGVMAAISEMAQPRDLETLIELISDKSLGSRRGFLVRNLIRSKVPKAQETLFQLKDDPQLMIEIAARTRNKWA